MTQLPSADSAVISLPNPPASRVADSLFLEIERGRTQFPLRRIRTPRFLIGSGARCDLRLGGNIPPLHSILLADGPEATIETVIPHPPLCINGREVEHAALRDGDRVELGGFTIVVHRREFAAASPSTTENEEPGLSDEVVQSPAEMSAAELIAEMEKEQALVAEFDRGIEQGARALLHAARARTQGAAKVPPAAATSSVPLQTGLRATRTGVAGAASSTPEFGELERTLAQLEAFVGRLEERSLRMSCREESYAEATAAMLDLQHRLTQQLETLCRKVATLEARQESSTARAIA